MVFVIHCRVRTIWFRIGYCEAWSRDGAWIRLLRPFKRCGLTFGSGRLECRGNWPHPDRVSSADHSLDPCAVEVWMIVCAEDLHEAAALLTQCIEPLNSSGFNRLSDL